MKPCLSGTTIMPGTFIDDVDACAAAGISGLEVWITKLENQLRDHEPAKVRDHIAAKQISLAAASYQGGLLLSQGEARRAHFDHFKRRLELCRYFAIPTLLLAADFAQRPQPQDLERAIVSLKQAAQWADGFGVNLALEFRGADALCSCLNTALQFVEHAGEKNLGVVLDAFHFYKGPSKLEDLDTMPIQRLAVVQVADVAGVPRELMSDSDRIMPGDGDFRLGTLLKTVKARGYDGWISLELFNPLIWQAPATHVAQIGYAALSRLIDEARKP